MLPFPPLRNLPNPRIEPASLLDFVNDLHTETRNWIDYADVRFIDVQEKAMAPHSSTFAWKTPWTEPGRLQSMGSLRVGHD